MTMLIPLATALSITATGPTAAVLLNTTPFLGGQSHNALLDMDAAPAGGGIIAVQGSTNNIHNPPATGDASWTTLYTLNAASPLEQEVVLPQWVRLNVTTVGTGTINVRLNGVQ